jgi:hypothetical protein
MESLPIMTATTNVLNTLGAAPLGVFGGEDSRHFGPMCLLFLH